MKAILKTFVCLLLSFFSFLNVEAKTEGMPSIGLYLGGENGTEYVIEVPYGQKTIVVGETPCTPLRFTDYKWNGGVFLSIKVKFAGVYNYSKVTVKSTLGYNQEYSVVDNAVWIREFFPSSSPKAFSVFIEPKV